MRNMELGNKAQLIIKYCFTLPLAQQIRSGHILAAKCTFISNTINKTDGLLKKNTTYDLVPY